MKFEVNREEFLKKLQTVNSIVSARTSYPILQNILLEAKEDKLYISGNDLDSYIEREVPLKGEAGKTILPGKKLMEIVKELSSETLTLETTNEYTIITAERNIIFKIPKLDPSEYPEKPELPKDKEFELPLYEIIESLENVSFATSKDVSRPAMGGIFWEMKKDGMRMVSTDGHRLAFIEKSKEIGEIETFKAIISVKFYQLLPSSVEKEEVAKFYLDKTKIGFVFGDTTIISRLIEGPYPDYERVIPKGNPNILTIAKEAMIPALRRVSIFSDPYNHLVKLKMMGDKLILSSLTAEIGEAKEELLCSYKGEEMEIGYNSYYLLEIVNHIESDEVVFELSTPTSAVLIRPSIIEEGGKKLFLLMPIRME